MKTYVMDSYALIAYFEDETGADAVLKIFTDCFEEKAVCFMTVINWGEVFYSRLRVSGEDAAVRALEIMADLPMEIVDADQELALRAARYKAFHKLSYADAFAAALAKIKGAHVVTGDKEFAALSKEIHIEWLR